jgi:hypothetical protein
MSLQYQISRISVQWVRRCYMKIDGPKDGRKLWYCFSRRERFYGPILCRRWQSYVIRFSLFLSDIFARFKPDLYILIRFLLKSPTWYITEIFPVIAGLIHADRQTDIYDDGVTLFSRLYDRAQKSERKRNKEKTVVLILWKRYGINNSYVVESLRTQLFPIWTNSPHFWNRDFPYRIHQSSQHTPGLNETIPIRAFTSAPQIFIIIFLLEVFSPKHCTLGGLFANLQARSHYVFGTSCDRLSQHKF